MQKGFEARLLRMRWNNFDGYHKTERFRHMIEDGLLLDQGFLDLALHPLVKQILKRYFGPDYELTEAKGWKSLPTRRDFHGWHGDTWYDQAAAKEIHKEIKLGVYLTDVRSGAFNFIKGSHHKQHPRDLKRKEVRDLPLSQLVELTGPAGTAFMFDTSAIHRQGLPMLEARLACGVPIVGSCTRAIPELVKEGETGLLVNPRDPFALADGIEKLACDKPLRQKMARAALARVHANSR
jgi:hypothetical protein